MLINPSYQKKQLLGVAITCAIALASCGKPPQQQTKSPDRAIAVDTQNLLGSQVRETSEFLGRMEAKDRVKLAPRVDGRVSEILVQEGERVSKGQTIIQLQQTREKAEVSAAVSEVNISRADLINAQAQVKSVEAEVAQAEAQIKEREADLRRQEAEVALAQTNMERAEFLVKEGAESKQFLDDRTQELNSALARQDALKEALNASQKSLIAARERVKAAIADVDRQQAALNQAQANVGVASENLDFNRVVAPMNGIIGSIDPRVGDYLEAGDRVTTITSNENLTINIGIPIEQASLIKPGLKVAVVSNRDSEPVIGRISFISPTTTQQSVLVKATVPNNGRLQDEQSVLARVIWSEKTGVLVPTTAVSRIAGQNFVFVAEKVEQDGKEILVARQKVVQLGDIQDRSYQVISGLEVGEQLITSGILNLTDGVPISSEEVSATSSQ